MLKEKLKFLGAGMMAVGLTLPAHALNIRLDKPVSVKEADGVRRRTVVSAYPDAKNCRIWYYVAGSQIVSGAFRHRTDVTGINIEGVRKLSYISTLDLRGNPQISPAHIEQLKEEIVKAIPGDPVCGREAIKKEDIVVSPARAHVMNDTKLNSGAKFYHDVLPTYGTSLTSYMDATDPLSITYVVDASNPSSQDDLRSMQADTVHGATEIGSLHYILDGITSQIDAKLSVKGEMTAEFDSAVKQTKCTTSDHSIDLNAASLGLAGGAASAGFGHVGLTDKTTKCNYDLLTQFEGGKFGMQVTFDFSGFNFDGPDKRPIQIVSCDEKGKCVSMNLESYVRQQLWALWLSTNMDVNTKQLSDKTFEITLGRKGQVGTKLDAEVSYRRSFYGELALEIPVYAADLWEKSFDFSNWKSQLATCVQNDYINQILAQETLVGVYPLPINKACLSGGTTGRGL